MENPDQKLLATNFLDFGNNRRNLFREPSFTRPVYPVCKKTKIF